MVILFLRQNYGANIDEWLLYPYSKSMRLYYKIWVDCISRMRSIESNKSDWKIKALISMTFAMTLNFVVIMVVLQREILGFYFYELDFPFLSDFANYTLTMIILYVLPCFVLNYLLIIYNKRYEKLQKIYIYQDRKHYFLIYMLISVFLPIVILGIGVFWGK